MNKIDIAFKMSHVSAGSAMPLKVLVSGDVDGKFGTLFSRVASVNKKNGPFEMLLSIGNFFGDDNSEWKECVSGNIKVPITTYVLGPCKPEHIKYFPDIEGGELAQNITYLGKKGVLTGSSGLKIAYLSGTEGNDKSNHHFTVKDVAGMQTHFLEGTERGVDILLTSQWPKGIAKYAGCPKDVDPDKCGTDLISKLAVIIKPRYHFCGLEGVHYERLPYRNHQVLAEPACHTTRFISLAKVGNAGKQKWLYAFTISPLRSMSSSELVKQPPDVTESPYKFSSAVIDTSKNEPSSQFFYDLNSPEPGQRKRHGEDHHKDKKHAKKSSQPLGSCWFCLRSPEVEKHLVVSIGDNCYLALAKGGLVPDHVLILPNGHHMATVELPDDVIEEMEKFKSALKQFFNSRDKSVVFFERNYKSPHLQIQVVPVPKKVKTRLKEIFMDYAASLSIDLDEVPMFTDIKQVVPPKTPYFYVELESGEKLLHKIHRSFPLQFGREVLASEPVLNMPHRTDWKACNVSKDEETQMCSKFREDFKQFDFTLL